MTPELSPDILAQLEQLRDIRLPEAIGWWPLAPGWWGVLALVCVFVLAGLIWNVVRKFTTRYLALRELDQMPGADPAQFATSISVLLRRVAMRKNPSTAQYKDRQWADFLSEKGMSRPIAFHLAEAPYAARFENAPKQDALRSAAAQWIRRQA